MSEDKKQWVVIVNVKGWQSMWRPFVCELSRDRPKTIFTRAMYSGELRWHKDDIKYQIFDREAQAKNVMHASTQHAIHAHLKAIQAEKDARLTADEYVKDAVAGAAWKGGMK